jgi:hypothetical protein
MNGKWNLLSIPGLVSIPASTRRNAASLTKLPNFEHKSPTESMYLRAAVCSHLSLSGYLPIKPDIFQRLTPDGNFQHLVIQMKNIIYTFLVKGECEMMPRSLTRLLAQFCEGFGQTCYMIKIPGKGKHI